MLGWAIEKSKPSHRHIGCNPVCFQWTEKQSLTCTPSEDPSDRDLVSERAVLCLLLVPGECWWCPVATWRWTLLPAVTNGYSLSCRSKSPVPPPRGLRPEHVRLKYYTMKNKIYLVLVLLIILHQCTTLTLVKIPKKLPCQKKSHKMLPNINMLGTKRNCPPFT